MNYLSPLNQRQKRISKTCLYFVTALACITLLSVLQGCESQKSDSLPVPTPVKDCPEGQLKIWKDGKQSCINQGKRG